MRDWVENVLITEPTMHKMKGRGFSIKMSGTTGVGRGVVGCQTAKPEKPQELPTGKKWWQNMPYYQVVNKTDVKKCRFDKIIVMETFQEILFWIPFCDKAGAADRPHSLFKIVPREISAGLLVIWAKQGNPRQVGVTNQAKIMRRLVAGGRFLCNFRIYRLIWEPGSVLRRCHQDIDAAAADIYNYV